MFPASKTAILSLLLLAGACRRDVAIIDPLQQLAYTVRPAVVRVNAYATAEFHLTSDDGSQDISAETGAGGSGSGFVVNHQGWIVTSAHVVAATRDRSRVEQQLRHNGAIALLLKSRPADELRRLDASAELQSLVAAVAEKGSLRNVVVTNRVELSNGETLPFTVAQFSDPAPGSGKDVALLHVTRRSLPSLRMADSTTVREQQQIWAAGYPAIASRKDPVIGGWLPAQTDLEASINRGVITAIKRDATGAPLFQTDVAIYTGNSGGPAVSLSGEVVGISTWSDASSDGIKFLVPANDARNLIAIQKVAINTEGPFDRVWRGALRAAAQGDLRAAAEQLRAANKVLPGSPDVARLMRDIESAERAASPLVRYRTPLIIMAALLAAVLLLLLLVALGKQRRERVVLPSIVKEVVVGADDDAAAERDVIGNLTILNGERAGERYGLAGSGIRIGRESSVCEIVLENPKVSRLHAEVVSQNGRVLLIDRNSSNGTYVNDRKVDRRFLRDGDIIYFGGRNAIAVAFHAASA